MATPVYDGDTILFYCLEATGYVYIEPSSSNSSLLTIWTSNEEQPYFPNVHFAVFSILHAKLLNEIQGRVNVKDDLRSAVPVPTLVSQYSLSSEKSGMQNIQSTSEPLTVVYGSTIKFQHLATGRYLSVTPTSSAWLDDGNSVTCIFRLIPPRQEKGWGEDLSLRDNIKLESVYHRGQRIQCVYNPLQSSYHLVLSLTGSVFSIKSHCSKVNTIHPEVIQGGSVIMLGSVKIDGYVSAKGSFADAYLPEKHKQFQKRVGVRRWRETFFKVLPFSGDTYLQLEKVSDTVSGAPLNFGEQCRIKHMVTQHYFAVNETSKGLKVVLQDPKFLNGSELFKLVNIDKTSKQKEVYSYNMIALQHISSQKLLAVNVRPDLQHRFSSQQDPLSQWFTLILDDFRDDLLPLHTYQVVKVEEDAVLDIYHITGITSFLCSYFKKLMHLIETSEMDEQKSENLIFFLQEVSAQMKGLKSMMVASVNKKRVANMLRTCQTVDIMITLLTIIGTGNQKKQETCCTVCLVLEKYVECGNKKSRHYLAKRELLNTLLELVGRGIGAEKVIIELSKDDVEMSDLMEEFLTSLIGTLNIENPDIAELMTTLAFRGKRLNRQIQNKILEKTLKAGMVHNYNANSDVREVLHSFVNKCVGQYMEQTQVHTERQWHTFNYVNLSSEPSQSFESNFNEDNLQLIQSMDRSICKYLSQSEIEVLYAGEDFKGRNSIIAQILGVLAFLIDYGAYTKLESVPDILHSLVKILDGSTDKASPGEPFQGSNRYSIDNFSGNKIIFKIKILALHSLQLFLKRHFNTCLELFMYDFKFLRGGGNDFYVPRLLEKDESDTGSHIVLYISLNDEENISLDDQESGLRTQRPTRIQRADSIAEDDSQRGEEDDILQKEPDPTLHPQSPSPTGEQIELTEVNVFVNTQDNGDMYPLYVPPPPDMKILLDHDEKITESLVKVSRLRLRYNFKNYSYSLFDIDSKECQTLCRILLDLMNYDDNDIRLMSAELLFDMYRVEDIVLSDVGGSYFTTPYSNQNVCLEMKRVASMTDREQILYKMMKRQVDDITKLLNTLNLFSTWCLSEYDETEPNFCNQGIAYSSGLYAVILEYVLEYGPSDYYDQEDILSCCFSLLQKISRKNPRVQRSLFLNFHDFMETKIAISSMTILLNEIFSKNSELCKSLTEIDIKQMFYTAIASSNPEHFELTVTLRTIIEGSEPATPVQEYIAQLFIDLWKDNLGHLLGPDNQSHRLDLLQHAEDDHPELQLLLNISDLLASCTEGECQFAESVARKFFDFKELLIILSDDDVKIHHKLPFVRLLTWIFLNTERDSALACSQLSKSSNFWSHLENQLHLVDTGVVKHIVTLSYNQKRVIQKKLRCLCKFHWSINQWMKLSAELNSLQSSATHAPEENLNGKLLYIIEGLVPLVSGFCHEMSLHLSGTNELCTGVLTSNNIGILTDLGKILAVLNRLKILTSSEHLNKLQRCLENVSSLQTSLQTEVKVDFDETISSLRSQSLIRNRTVSKSDLLNDDNPEICLNNDLQDYVSKYSQAYSSTIEGEETTDHIQESLTIPKGPSFEKLIDLFTDSDEDIGHGRPLKVNKLLMLLHTLIQKQKRQGVLSLERTSLERVTLITLQLLCGIVFKRITMVPRSDDPESFQRQYNEVILPIQKALLNQGIVEMFIELLHHPKDDIAFQVLACLNVILYPGNEEAQSRISTVISQQNHGLFIRVHQILRGAQSNIYRAKMGNALAQIASLMPDPMGDMDSSLAVKLLTRNKSAVMNRGWSLCTDNLALPPKSQIQMPRRKSAGIDEHDVGFVEKQSARSILPTMIGSGVKAAAFGGTGGIEFVDHRITMALNVLSWLCDGQRRDIQDVLREEKIFSGSNIVGQVAFLLHGIAEGLNENNLSIAQGAVQALIEMCAGNYSNQLLAFKGQVVMSIDIILQENFTSSNATQPLLKLKSSTIELLEVILEETDENSSHLAKWIIHHFELSNFLAAMFELWQAAFSGLFRNEQWGSSVFRAYHVLKRIADYSGISVDELVDYQKNSELKKPSKFDLLFEENTLDAKRMWQYCEVWSRSIEIVYKAKSGKQILTRVYFPYDPHKHLNENEKDTILLQIKRNTPQEKLSDLLQWTEAIRNAHEWKRKIKRSWKTRWLLYASTIRHFLLFWLTIFLNLMVLFGLQAPSNTDDNRVCIDNTCNSTRPLYFQPVLQPTTPIWYYPALYTFGIVHVILAVWMVLQYYSKHWINIRFEILIIKKYMYDIKKGLLRRKHIYRFIQLLNKIFCCGKIRANHPQPEKYFQIFFLSFEPLYRIFFTLCSLLSLFSSGYFYCGCMIYLFLRNQVLLYVLRAVRNSALQLLTVFVLGLVVMYIYAVISFALIQNYFNTEKDLFCETAFQCFITITRLGLLDTLGNGISIRPSSDYPPNFIVVGWRTLYDVIFFIVVTTLGLNIVIAILVDRFSDLRQEQDKIDDDNQSKCLICSIKKDVFERHGLDFHKHWQTEHNVWNYIHFVLYLDTVHPNDHNALEKHVYEQIPYKGSPGSIDFFPLFKAKVLSNSQEAD